MAWNTGKPADDEKIRSLGTVIRPNWEAIEQGDIVGTSDMIRQYSLQLRDRDDAGVVSDPTTQTETLYLYSKLDSGGVAEGFSRDAAGNIIQLTNDGKIGALDVQYECEDLNFDGNTTRVFNENSMAVAWGFAAEAGGLSYGHNVASVSAPSSSIYTVVLDANVVANTNYIVNVTTFAGTAYAVVSAATAFTAGATPTFAIRTNGATGGSATARFMFVVYGGQ